MSTHAESLLTEGNSALEGGDWPAARDAFRVALEVAETGESLLGMAEALWWSGELSAAVGYRERAYAAFRDRPDLERATMLALRIGFEYRAHVGNPAAAAGWLGRARRLITDHGLDHLRGWLLLFSSYDSDDPQQGEQWAREALDVARETSDLDLELCALSQTGALLAEQGHVAEGVARLDEAMAGSLGGEGSDLDTVVFTSCNMITSCTRCAEFERAVQWIRAADRFTQRYGCPFLFAECRTFYGAVLVAIGDWQQAEEELLTAVDLSRDAVPVLHREALAALASLRVAQGRLEPAERLVAGFADHHAAAPVQARIHLLRDEPELAAAIARRQLRAVGEQQLERAALLELLGEAEIAHHDDAPVERGRQLTELGTTLDCGIIRARGDRLWGRSLAARGDVTTARAHLEGALAEFVRLEMPYEAARTRMLLARALRHDRPDVAVELAGRALAVFEDLGAGRDADAGAAFLRELGVNASRSGPRDIGTLTKRQREVFGLLAEGLSNPEIAERLYISRKTVEHHVASVLSTLGLRSRAEAAAAAVRGGQDRATQ